jgi:hypothetical protein
MHQQSRSTGSQECDDLELPGQHSLRKMVADGNSREKVIQPNNDPMGKFPVVSAQVFSDLGLSSLEIARYFGVTEQRIIDLKKLTESA